MILYNTLYKRRRMGDVTRWMHECREESRGMYVARMCVCVRARHGREWMRNKIYCAKESDGREIEEGDEVVFFAVG